jgi:predicted Rossmann fold nucleotide-binding protein DprA/Smf involved in DNA uptake
MTDKEIILSLINENKLLKEEKKELINEKNGLKHILQERINTIDELNNEKYNKRKDEREKSDKILDILNRLNKKIEKIPFKKTD